MKRKQTESLSVLVDLRESEKQQLVVELAGQNALVERYRTSLARLEALGASVGASAAQPAANLSLLSLNCGDYKQVVMGLAAGQRDELGVHEAELKRVERELLSATHKHEALSQVLGQQQLRARRQEQRQEQKGQDEMATQSWLRRQA